MFSSTERVVCTSKVEDKKGKKNREERRTKVVVMVVVVVDWGFRRKQGTCALCITCPSVVRNKRVNNCVTKAKLSVVSLPESCRVWELPVLWQNRDGSVQSNCVRETIWSGCETKEWNVAYIIMHHSSRRLFSLNGACDEAKRHLFCFDEKGGPMRFPCFNFNKGNYIRQV